MKIVSFRILTVNETNIVVIRLNRASSYNALDLDMIKYILTTLDECRNDDSVEAIFIDSEVSGIFCAGGDIKALYYDLLVAHKHSQANVKEACKRINASFFATEYTMNYCLHTFPKPVICWGNGLVMGGGAGIFCASSIKIATQNTRFAMPEVNIGLFPDVGASYFLNQIDASVAKFLALTGAQISAEDCYRFKLSDYLFQHEDKPRFLQELAALERLGDDSIKSLCVRFMKLKPNFRNDAWLLPNLAKIEDLAFIHSREDIHRFFKALSASDESNEFLRNALKRYDNACPLSVCLAIEQLIRGQQQSLSETFMMELSMAYHCCLNNDFMEGVRALLIDKDNQTKWKHASILDVPNEQELSYFFNYDPKICAPLISLEHKYGIHKSAFRQSKK